LAEWNAAHVQGVTNVHNNLNVQLGRLDSNGISGSYTGVVHNLTGDISSTFGILTRDSAGSLEGCLEVHAPLYGSGPLTGVRRGTQVEFEVKNSIYTLIFHGTVHGDEFSGSYTATAEGGTPQEGRFNLERKNDIVPGSVGRCFTDEEINSR
jgi:hypothetical protein